MMRAPHKNHAVAIVACTVFLGMVGLAYAAVPLYRMFCEATGFQGALRTAALGPAKIGQRMMTVRFDSNVAAGLDWSFEPEVGSLSLPTGKVATVYYRVTNHADHTITAKAADNVSPDAAGRFFAKIKCFCDEDKTLAAGESAEMPVVFFLDDKLDQDPTMAGVESVTLSYTYFAAKHPAVVSRTQSVPKQF